MAAGIDRHTSRMLEWGIFLRPWYELMSGKRFRSDKAAIQHLFEEGSAQGLSPHPLFDPVFYLRTHQDVAEAQIDPLVHYLSSGAAEGRAPSSFVRMGAYRDWSDASGVALDERGILAHFVRSDDMTAALIPFAGFAGNRAVEDYFVSGLPAQKMVHPVITGLPKGGPQQAYRCLADLFDENVEAPAGYLHERCRERFLRSQAKPGTKNGLRTLFDHPPTKRPWFHPLIDPASIPEGDDSSADPFQRFLAHREVIEENPNSYLDGAFYRASFMSGAPDGQTVLQHYEAYGRTSVVEPSRKFGQRYYLRQVDNRLPPGTTALGDWLHRGRREAIPRLPATPFLDETRGWTAEELARSIADVSIEDRDPAKVKILIPTYANVEDTLRCVRSIVLARNATPFEILVIDDASPNGEGDALRDLLAEAPNCRVKINQQNLGFLRSVNAAAEDISTDFIHILNNDTVVLDDWLDTLVDLASTKERAGIVGSKLLYPNGLLQEAGGIIWRDGVFNFGRMDDPNAPGYRHVRQVDYCSGASLLVRQEAWTAVGGFSDAFAPAYYEDTDLACKMRETGYEVYYQPRSSVVHIEGVSSGLSIEGGVKRHQAINEATFREKWEAQTAGFGDKGRFDRRVTNRYVRGRICFIDADLPMPDRDSGSVTAVHVMKGLVDLGYHVIFVAANLNWIGQYADILERAGVEVLGRPYVDDLEAFLATEGADFDLFWIARAPTAARFLPIARNLYPDVPVVFDTVDLHYLRMEREAQASGDPEALEAAALMRRTELSLIKEADLTMLVSSFEAELLKKEIGPFAHLQLPLVYDDYQPLNGFSERRGIAFVGGFRHPPNRDATEWLLSQVWPEVRRAGFDEPLYIVGSDMPRSFEDLPTDGVELVGFVPELERFLEGVRLTVAPLRYGAGVKGKVGNSLRLGVPVVGTACAFEGMGVEEGEGVRTAQTPDAFARIIRNLAGSEEQWTELSAKGRSFARKRFGRDAARRTLARAMDALLGSGD